MKPYKKRPVLVFAEKQKKDFTVKTLEGTMKGKAGDYLVVGINGEKYPVKERIFELLYDKVELVFEDMLKCHTCNVPFTKIDEHQYKGNCTHTINLRLSVG